ncbi:hypothetical protein [Candidatus Enterovibrio escicola]|uniref:hypothetical protein n=1 Tax=Candidatus Enterovibrio escicola TaxID=1927127 RepID=UPI001237F0FA|nr:hypothetical protein [Candidatus Enterovibrio escacola]
MNSTLALSMTTSIKIVHWVSTPSLQRLVLPLLIGVMISLSLPYFIGDSPTVAEFDAVPATLCLCLSFLLLINSPLIEPRFTDNVFAITLAILLAFPSFQGTLAVLLFLAIWIGNHNLRSNTRLRTCAVIIAVCALQTLLVFYALKWFTEPVLAIDAKLVASILSLVTGSGYATSNVYAGPSEYQVLMLRNCSSLPTLISAFTCWFAIARWHGIAFTLRECTVVLTLMLFTLSLNIMRLFSMGISMQWHAWWHSALGKDTYLFISVVLTLSIIFWGIRYAKTEHNH